MCDSDSIVATGKMQTFKKFLASAGSTPIFAFFYSPSCGHCITLKRHFDTYRSKCQSSKQKVIIIYINKETASEIFQHYNITSWPQVMIFKNNKKIDHIIGADVEKLQYAFKKVGL